MEKPKPKLILVSGKRYSGKDTSTNLLSHALENKGYNICILSTALSFKTQFCLEHGLDLNKFLNDR